MTWTQDQLTPWLAALQAGEVVAAPAEGVYGYCCDPFNPKALEKLLALKQRDANKGMIVLIPDVLALKELCLPLSESQLMQIYQHWGQQDGAPVTLVLSARPELPANLTGGRPSIAVRCPFAEYMKEYLLAWNGPLVSTSANLSGQPPIADGKDLPAGVPALTLPQPLPGTVSRVYDLLNDQWLR